MVNFNANLKLLYFLNTIINFFKNNLGFEQLHPMGFANGFQFFNESKSEGAEKTAQFIKNKQAKLQNKPSVLQKRFNSIGDFEAFEKTLWSTMLVGSDSAATLGSHEVSRYLPLPSDRVLQQPLLRLYAVMQ